MALESFNVSAWVYLEIYVEGDPDSFEYQVEIDKIIEDLKSSDVTLWTPSNEKHVTNNIVVDHFV